MTLKAIKTEIKELEATIQQLWANSDRLKAEIKEDPSTKEAKTVEIINNHAHIRGVECQIHFLKRKLNCTK